VVETSAFGSAALCPSVPLWFIPSLLCVSVVSFPPYLTHVTYVTHLTSVAALPPLRLCDKIPLQSTSVFIRATPWLI
jgi:hypothetical protein